MGQDLLDIQQLSLIVMKKAIYSADLLGKPQKSSSAGGLGGGGN